MKKILLVVTILAAIALISPVRPTATQHEGDGELLNWNKDIRMERVIEARRRLMNPHDGLTNLAHRAEELARLTSRVAATLPSKQTTLTNRGIEAQAFDNVIDREIFATLEARNVKPAAPATDEEICRRLFLDITGQQPTPERLLKYINDTDPDKKGKLITELLATEAYADRWANWLGDLTRNFAVLGDASDRNAQHFFLRDAIAKNRPFNQVATDMIAYTGDIRRGPGAFVLRPILGSETSQDAFDEIAAEATRTFLGVPTVCVSCHDGQRHLEQVNLYLTGKKRSEYWGLSAFFAQTKLNVRISDFKKGEYIADTDYGARPPRSGGVITPSYALFGQGSPNKGETRRAAFARLITADVQFSRAFVNRVFAQFFGLGLVEPLNGFDLARLDPNNPPPDPWQLQPSHPVLLNELARSFQQSGYDVKALIRLIASSEAYALSSRYEESEWRPEYTHLFARKLVRRLSAEEILDAITSATGVPGSYAAIGIARNFSTAMALPGVEDPYPDNPRPQQSDPPALVFRFMQDFGRGDRFLRNRNDSSSVLQALDLFNSDIVTKRIENDRGLPNTLLQSVQQGKLSATDAVTQLYLMTIARRPSTAEIEQFKDRFKNGKEAVADLQWALLNRPEFIYNY
ncbi:MAG: DUF1553 domain-containing protein [Acidobacteriota bacterium]